MVRTDRENKNRSAAGFYGKLNAYGRAALSTEKIAYGGTDRKFGTWPPSRARSTYYYYTMPGRTCQVFFETKIKNPRFLHLGRRGIKGMVFTAVTASHLVGRILVGIVASRTTSALIVTDVIIIGVPEDSEVVALIHRVIQCTLAGDGTVAVVRTVPTIHRAVDVSHYCLPPQIAMMFAITSIIARPASISCFSP